MGALLIALGLALLVQLVWAGDSSVPWYVGLPVVQVSLEAPLGGLPRENLEPLLRVHQGDPFDPGQARQDIELLYRAGAFAAVEVIADPWVDIGPDDTFIDAVRISYRVVPPPRLADIQVDGAHGVARRVVLAAAGLHLGQAFYGSGSVEGLEERVIQALSANGWPGSTVALDFSQDAEREVQVLIEVQLAPVHRYGQVAIAGSVFETKEGPLVVGRSWRPLGWLDTRRAPPLPRHKVRRRLRHNGVRRGRRVTRAGVEGAQNDIDELMVAEGWLQGRVSFLFPPAQDDTPVEDVTAICEGGTRTTVRAVGRELPEPGAMQDVLGLHAGDRVHESTADGARERLLSWFDERGYLGAEVSVSVEEAPWGVDLVVRADPGPRYVTRRIAVEGAHSMGELAVAGAMREAAPDSLGRRVLSQAGMDEAMRAVEEMYRGQGYLSTRVEQTDLELGGRRLPLPFRLGGVWVTPHVRVEEGPRTRLIALDVRGGTGLEAPVVQEARASMVGQPISPAGLDALASAVAEVHRESGYLGADVRFETDHEPGSDEATATLIIDAGNPVRLRSVVIRGNQRTRRSVIEREVALTVGEPIATSDIARTRSHLYDLDLFTVVEPQLIGDDDRSRDLLVRVEEKSNVALELGGGLATDQGVQATAKAAHRNLGGLGQRIEAIGRIGYGWAGESWRIETGEAVWSAGLRYEAPSVPARGQRMVIEGLLHETIQQPSYSMDRSGGRIGLRIGRAGVDEIWLDYGVQLRRIDDIDPGALVTGDPWLPAFGLHSDLSGTLKVPSDIRMHAGPSLLLLRDRRDDRFNPSEGGLVSLTVEVADGVWAEPLMAKTLLRTERLIPIGSTVFAIVGRGGVGWAQGDATTLPVEERFYLGGSSSLRGFRLDQVSPANLSSRPVIPYPGGIGPLVEGTALRDEPAHWVSTGGDAMAALTLELRLPLPLLGLSDFDSTSLVLFSDMGRVGFLDPDIRVTSDQHHNPLLRVGVGAGLRIATPIGPAAIDLGINPHPLDYRDEPLLVPHFSLGAL